MLSLVFVIEGMGQVFRLNFVIAGLFAGTQLGIFSIGMMSRTANTKGVISGAIAALLTVGTIIVGAQSLPKHPALPVRTDGCDPPLNLTIPETTNHEISHDEIPLVFQLSFMYYTILGTIILFIVALPVSWATGGCEPFDERLLTPFARSQNWKEKNEIIQSHDDSKLKITFYKTLDTNELKKAVQADAVL